MDAFDWIVVVEDKDTTLEELAYCEPQFASLDQKLLKALQRKARDVMLLEINQYYEDAKRARKMDPDAAKLRGRQARWLVYEHFRTSSHDGTLYGFRHLQLVEWKGDKVKELEFFDSEITRVLGGIENQPREEDIQDHYVRQFRKTTSMKEDLAYFDRLDSDHKNKSWKYLRSCLRKQIFRVRAAENEDDLCPPEAVKKIAAGIGGGTSGGGKGGGPRGICPFDLKGTCRDGDKCPMQHQGDKAAVNSIKQAAKKQNITA